MQTTTIMKHKILLTVQIVNVQKSQIVILIVNYFSNDLRNNNDNYETMVTIKNHNNNNDVYIFIFNNAFFYFNNTYIYV